MITGLDFILLLVVVEIDLVIFRAVLIICISVLNQLQQLLTIMVI